MKPRGSPKTGGRQKGTLNKSTKDLLEKAELLGVDPFEVLLLYAKRDWVSLGYDSATVTKVLKDGGTIEVERISSEKQIECAKEVCQYLYPKRKAVEISTDQESEGFKIVIQDYSKKDAGT